MSHRTPAPAALLVLACAGFIPSAASAAGPAAYSFTPGTVLLTNNWRLDPQGIAHFDTIVLKPDGCLLREFVFTGTQAQTIDSSCHLTPGESLPLGKTGVFVITVDFADHSQQIIFRTTPSTVGAQQADNPGLSGVLLNNYYSMTSPPPAIDAQGVNRASSAATPAAHQTFHLVTDGLDCRFELVGEGSTPCVVSAWTDRDLSVLISGAFLHQPDAVVKVEANRTAQGWVMVPLYYVPYSALKLAVQQGDLQAVDALLTQQSGPGISGADLDDALRAAIPAHMDIAKTLVDHGAPLNSSTQYEVPLLDLAAGSSSRDRAKALDLVTDMVARGASVTQGGSSSLFYAIGANDPVMVKFLLDHGADANAVTDRGSTEVSAYEDSLGNVAILDLLIQHGAKPQGASAQQRPLGPAPQGYQYVQGASGAVAVVAPSSPSPPGQPVRQYEYSGGSSQPAGTQAGGVAAQGSVVLYGGDRGQDGFGSGQALLMDASHCKYHVMSLAAGGASSADYPCKLMPGGRPIVPGQFGMFVVSLQLPEGRVTLSGRSNDGIWFDMQSASQQPVALKLATRLGLMRAPLPVLQLDSDVQPGTHLALDGFDCRISVAGQGSSACVLAGWGPLGPGGASQTSVLVSGDFLRQPDPSVFITLTQAGAAWTVKPAHLYPYTPVMIAAYRGDLASLQALIAKGADLDSHDPHLDAPLALAISRDHPDVAALLIAHGAKQDALTLAGGGALSDVIAHEWHDPAQPLALVTQLLDQGADPNQADKDGMTPLAVAITRGHKDVVQLLVAKGADVNARPGSGRPPLDLAISAGDLDDARLLIAHGADVNAPMYDGDTPLMLAIQGGQVDPAARRDFVQFLIDHGADVNHADAQGGTPLMVAAMAQQPDITKLLLAKGANPHAKVELNGQAIEAAGLATMLKQYQAVAAAEEQARRPLANQGIPMGALLGFRPGAFGSMKLVGQPGAAGPGETLTVTDVNSGKRSSTTVHQDGSFTVALAGAAHDLFMLQMSDPQQVADAKAQGVPADRLPSEKRGPPVYLHGDDPALTLTARVASDAPYTDSVSVTGTYTGPQNVGIQVGGYTAMAGDGKFVINQVRLQQGDNTIPIKLITQGGLVLQQTLKLTGAGQAGILVGLDPYAGGVAPLKADFFCYSLLGKDELKSLRFSYLDDGKDDVAITDPQALLAAAGRAQTRSLVYTYAKPGIYHARATGVTASGVAVGLQTFVMVQDPAKLDAVIKALWADYLTAFASRDKAALMQLLDQDAQPILGAAFDQQQDHAKDILKGYSALQGGALTGGAGIYTFLRDGQTTVVKFGKDVDGVWRIDSIGQ